MEKAFVQLSSFDRRKFERRISWSMLLIPKDLDWLCDSGGEDCRVLQQANGLQFR